MIGDCIGCSDFACTVCDSCIRLLDALVNSDTGCKDLFENFGFIIWGIGVAGKYWNGFIICRLGGGVCIKTGNLLGLL